MMSGPAWFFNFAALPAKGFSPSASSTIGVWSLASRLGTSLSRSALRPRPGPMARTSLTRARPSSCGSAVPDSRPASSCGSGAVIRHALPAATTGQTLSGTATRTSPAPLRKAALPHSTAAPDMPRLPAAIKARPKSPLWLSGARGFSRGTCVISSTTASRSQHTRPACLGGQTSSLPCPSSDFYSSTIMAYEPSDTLKNRSFLGLIVAQFLAGFNDQFIHAAAMFYAIRMAILNEAQAIFLMPILFYAPWAIFCTLAGFLADRFSKRHALVIWKMAEIVIGLIALLGFYLGTVHGKPMGAWLVMSTVFLMGTHAAFFAPAKYGAMPELLQPHVLSRGNGILESTTFLAAIFGTVAGGSLSYAFHDKEYLIGVVLLALAVIGAMASLLIRYLPPANPGRLFPKNLFKPLFDNLGVMFRSRPLALAALGIAFFIFMV